MPEHMPPINVEELLRRVRTLVAALERSPDDGGAAVCTRLKDSVIRPLAIAVEIPEDSVTGDHERSVSDLAAAGALGDRIWDLAKLATTARARSVGLAGLAEAAAALQDLAISLAGDESHAAHRTAELTALLTGLDPRIQCAHNGPYLVINVSRVVDWLGRPLPERPQLALCRCGASAIKPLCDGSHARTGFLAAKDPKRVEDRLDHYVGQQVTILDNRGTCQHSGLCTDRLATVFRLGQAPFAAPSGGRMDEIIRAVRDCPSGALSYAIDGVQARAEVDWHATREPRIDVSKDGPLRVTGAIDLVDQDGAPMPRNAGASREHSALCRRGHSQNKPFCSGMHWYVEFHDPVPDPESTPTMFEWAGGLPALTGMTRLFYEKHVPQDALLAPLFATMSADHPERVRSGSGRCSAGHTATATSTAATRGCCPNMSANASAKSNGAAGWRYCCDPRARQGYRTTPNSDRRFSPTSNGARGWRSRTHKLRPSRPSTCRCPGGTGPRPTGPPGSRTSALAAREQEPEPAPVLPEPDEPLSFGQHIKPLFRQRDRQSMQFAFDLWSADDVRQHAVAILERIRNGTMPCDGAWPQDRIDVFARWVDSGLPE